MWRWVWCAALVLGLSLSAAAKPEIALFVKAEAVNLRAGPGQSYPVIDTLRRATEVRVKEAKGFWRKVFVPSTRQVGWVAHWLLAEAPPPGVYREICYINADVVNLREGPGAERFRRIGILHKGERVEVIAYHEQWRKIRVPSNGEVGWVAAWLLKSSGQASCRPANLRFVKVEDFLHLRSGPGVRYRSLAKLKRGQRVYLVKTQGKWCQVKVHGTLQLGWVHRDYLSDTPPGSTLERLPAEVRDPPPFVKPVAPRQAIPPALSAPASGEKPQPASGKGTIPSGVVNIRSGPGTSFPIVGQAAVGAQFVILEQANGWYHVRFASGLEGWIASWLTRVAGVPQSRAQPTALGNAIAQEALRQVGKPYAWGKAGPDSFDCSGLVKYCLERCGIRDYPRRTFDQVKVGRPVSLDQLIPGDIVFFANTYTRGVSHVGIYVGNGQFVHAPESGARVRVEPLANRARSYYCARRVY